MNDHRTLLSELRQLEDNILKSEVWLKDAESLCAGILRVDMPLDQLEDLARKHQVIFLSFFALLCVQIILVAGFHNFRLLITLLVIVNKFEAKKIKNTIIFVESSQYL